MRAFVPFFGILALIHLTSAAPSKKVLPKHDDLVLVEREHCEDVTLRTDMEMAGQIKSVIVNAAANSKEADNYCHKDRNWGHIGNKLWIQHPCPQLLVSVCYMKKEDDKIKTDSNCETISLRSQADSEEDVEKIMPGPITSVELAAGLPASYSRACIKDATYGFFESLVFVNSGCRGVFNVCYTNDSLVGANKKPAAEVHLSPLAYIMAQTGLSIRD